MNSPDAQAAVDAFNAYTQAFQSGEAQAVARYFHIPSLMVNADATVAFTSEADVSRVYGDVMAKLRKLNYARTEFANLSGRRLSDDLALVSANGLWRAADGGELSRFGTMYTLRSFSGSWKIVSAVIYPQ